MGGQTFSQNIAFKKVTPQYELKLVKLNSKEDLGLFNDINEDDEGYIWVSSANGLHVFDGNKTITYTDGKRQFGLNIDSIQKPFIFFTQAGKNQFWVQQSGGRLILMDSDKRMVKKIISNENLNSEKLVSAYINKLGEMFMFTLNSGKQIISLYKKNEKDSLSLIYQTNVFYHHGPIIKMVGFDFWIWNGDYFIRLDKNGKVQNEYKNVSFLNSTVSIWSNDSSFYFINLQTYTIFNWNREKDQLEPYLKIPSYIKSNLTGLCIHNDKIFIADNLYLYILDLQNKTVQDLSENFVNVIRDEPHGGLGVNFLKFIIKKDGTIWLSNLRTILEVKDKLPSASRFRIPINDANLTSNTTSFRALAEDENNNIYVSYYGGIASKKADSESFEAISHWKHLINKDKGTYSLNYWKGHMIWNNMVINLKTNKCNFIGPKINAGHSNQFIKNDTLWLYIWHTNLLYCYDLKSKKQTEILLDKRINEAGFYYYAINDICADASGQNFWISSTFEGIQLVSKSGQLIKKYYKADLHTADDDIQELELTGNFLWFGCPEGLGRLNTKTGSSTIFKNPLIKGENVMQNRGVYSIIVDTIGNLYLGSSYGLLYFNTQSLQFYHLPKGHPLSTNEFNKMSTLRSRTGRYYFGSTDGLFSFLPQELQFIKSSNKIKPIKLIGTSIFNQQNGGYRYEHSGLNHLQKLILRPSENNLELQFSVPEFENEVYYSHRLKEQKNTWSDFKVDNKIQLSGLEPGIYTLEVRASTSLSEEDASIYTLTIEKQQIWYKKGWVIFLFAFLSMSMLLLLLRYRYQQKLKRQKELADLRTKISSDLHDEVGTLLSGLAMHSQILAIEAKDNTKEALNEISQMGREAMERMRDTVWAIDSRKDKVENLIDRMKDHAEKNLPLKKMNHEFINQITDSRQFINPEKRQNIYLIFKEAINNILKHSDGNYVTIICKEEKEKLKIIVKDNGKNNLNAHSDGQGISNMKMRAIKIGGNLTIRYEDGFIVELDV